MTTSELHRFDTDTRVTRVGEGRWTAQVSPAWNSIGGQPNGGYTLTVVLAAVSETVPMADPLSSSVHYLKPAEVGPAEIEVEVLKRGRRKTTVQARMSQQGSERLRVLATYGDRDGAGFPTEFSPAPPELPAPDDCVAPTFGAGPEATIAQEFDYRVTPDSRWVRGTRSGTACIDCWIRFADGREPDLTSLPLFADSFAPSIYEVLETALVPTVDLGIHFRQRPEPGWIQARFSTRALLGGVIEEDGELWDSRGRLVAMTRQLALVLPFG
jgi:acyl-CoA thioesterase